MPIWLIIYLITALWIGISMALTEHFTVSDAKKPFSQWKARWTDSSGVALGFGCIIPVFLLLQACVLHSNKFLLWPFVLAGRVIKKIFLPLLHLLSRTSRNLLFSLRPKSARTLADLVCFKNKEMKKWRARLKDNEKALEQTLQNLEKHKEQLVAIQTRLRFNPEGLKNDIERNEKILEIIDLRIKDFVKAKRRIITETHRLENTEELLNTRLELHDAYAGLGPLLKDLDDTREPAVDYQANLAAAQETVRGLTAALNEAEMEVMARLGMAPDKIAKDWLKAQGLEPVEESAEQVIAEAKKVLT